MANDGRRSLAMKAARSWVLCGGWLWGLSAASPLQAQELPAPPQAPVPGQMGDAWITTRIRAALVPLQRDGNADVRVTTTEGIVTLEGAVDSRITYDQVVELAGRV
ncbi:MAG: BON domain-containing protein, partial [Stenotrophomonas nitritireducens]|nr:BON domain-containing protein [Stenotrophomonas nitritireducens]